MQAVKLNRAINKENKYYGLKLTGLIFGAVLGIVVLIILNMTAGIIATLIGYGAGAYIGAAWHVAKLQRWIYWHLPGLSWSRDRYHPPSHIRKFM